MIPLKFMAYAPQSLVTAREVKEIARQAEALGFHSIVIPDHLFQMHAPIPLLATAAAVTTSLRVGPLVLNNSLRHPAVLAHELASLDVLSGGRLDIGIGAGWKRPEYDAIGLPFPSNGTRVSRLSEAITVLKGCFAPGPFSFAGEHYTITDFDGVPEISHKPHPPFFIGGGGRRVLSLAADEADVVGLAPRVKVVDGIPEIDAHSLTASATEEKIKWIREAAGERFPRLEINAWVAETHIVKDNVRQVAAERAARLQQRTGDRLTVDELLDSPHFFIGSAYELADKVLGIRERFGISSFMLGTVEEAAPIVEILAGK